MSSTLRKFKKRNINVSMSIKIVCPTCKSTKLIPQSIF